MTTGLQIIGEVDGDDWMVSRPLQKYISGNWYNVEQHSHQENICNI
ncbi:hypothetical protein [Escherichia coli]|nr:hypothetical protein [Escherichia coli]